MSERNLALWGGVVALAVAIMWAGGAGLKAAAPLLAGGYEYLGRALFFSLSFSCPRPCWACTTPSSIRAGSWRSPATPWPAWAPR